MNYKINLVPSFKKDVKKLSKKYKHIKQDLLILKELFISTKPDKVGISLGKNCYKIRIKNSDNKKGKNSGYRVIYFYLDKDVVTLLSIYSKSEIQNISDLEISKRLEEL